METPRRNFPAASNSIAIPESINTRDDSVVSDLSKFLLHDTDYSQLDLNILGSDRLDCDSYSQTGNFSTIEPIKNRISMIQSSHSIKAMTDKLHDLGNGLGKWTEPTPNISRVENDHQIYIEKEKTDLEKMHSLFENFTIQVDKRIEKNEASVNIRIDGIVKELDNLKSAMNLQSITHGINSKEETSNILPHFLTTNIVDSDIFNRLNSIDAELKCISKLNIPVEVKLIKKDLSGKVDKQVIEELMRHIATRDELKALAESIHPSDNFESIKRQESLLNQVAKKKMDEKIKSCRKECDLRVKNMEVWLKNEIVSLKTSTQLMISNLMPSKEVIIETAEVKMMTSTDMDDKFAILCSELSSCKLAWQQSIRQPFYRSAQWVWKSGLLKQGTSSIPWNIETTNTDVANMLWEEDSAVIRIEEGGLYEISFAFFTKTKPSIQIIVNGESVMSAINSPSYVVHHSSGYMLSENGCLEPGTVSGLSLIDYLALPFKSTISLCYHGGRKGMLGHGFLGLRKL